MVPPPGPCRDGRASSETVCTGDLPFSRCLHSGAALPGGRIAIATGCGSGGYAARCAVELPSVAPRGDVADGCFRLQLWTLPGCGCMAHHRCWRVEPVVRSLRRPTHVRCMLAKAPLKCRPHTHACTHICPGSRQWLRFPVQTRPWPCLEARAGSGEAATLASCLCGTPTPTCGTAWCQQVPYVAACVQG